MSETSQGPGWWIASDGRWYPPELHPDRRLPPPEPLDERDEARLAPAPPAPGAERPTEPAPTVPADGADAPKAVEEHRDADHPEPGWSQFRAWPPVARVGAGAVAAVAVIAVLLAMASAGGDGGTSADRSFLRLPTTTVGRGEAPVVPGTGEVGGTTTACPAGACPQGAEGADSSAPGASATTAPAPEDGRPVLTAPTAAPTSPEPGPQAPGNQSPAPETTTATTLAATSDTLPPSIIAAICDAVRAAGAAPLRQGDPGYGPELDPDGDGVACA